MSSDHVFFFFKDEVHDSLVFLLKPVDVKRVVSGNGRLLGLLVLVLESQWGSKLASLSSHVLLGDPAGVNVVSSLNFLLRRLKVRWRLLDLLKVEIVRGLSQLAERIHSLVGRRSLFLLLILFKHLSSSVLLFFELKSLQLDLLSLFFFYGSKVIIIKHGFLFHIAIVI